MKTVRVHILLLLSFVFMSSCSRHSPAPVKDVKAPKYNRDHRKRMTNRYQPEHVIVKKGDTLYALGFKHNIDFKKLAEINRINPPYQIYSGQKLYLKETKQSKSTQTAQAHSVQIKPQLKSSIDKNSETKKQIVKSEQSHPVVNKTPQVVKKPTVKKPTVQKPVTNKPVTNKPSVPQPVAKPVVKKPPTTTVAAASSKWTWPVNGPVISTFSANDVSRKGIDISVKQGASVRATNNGTVVYSGDGLLGYGELIIIKHTDNLLSAYAHNSQRLVKEGQVVKQGEQIAKSGRGNDGKALLHFEIRKNGQPINPLKYLPKK